MLLRCASLAVFAVVAAGCPKENPTLTVDLQGNGKVTSLPAGIDCPTTCTATFPNGTAVSLKAAGAEPNMSINFEIADLPPSTQPLRSLTLDQDRRVTVTLKAGEAAAPPTPVTPLPPDGAGMQPVPPPPVPDTPTKPAPIPPG